MKIARGTLQLGLSHRTDCLLVLARRCRCSPRYRGRTSARSTPWYLLCEPIRIWALCGHTYLPTHLPSAHLCFITTYAHPPICHTESHHTPLTCSNFPHDTQHAFALDHRSHYRTLTPTNQTGSGGFKNAISPSNFRPNFGTVARHSSQLTYRSDLHLALRHFERCYDICCRLRRPTILACADLGSFPT